MPIENKILRKPQLTRNYMTQPKKKSIRSKKKITISTCLVQKNLNTSGSQISYWTKYVQKGKLSTVFSALVFCITTKWL